MAESAITGTREQLARLSRLAAIGELNAHFAHEVANPLTLLLGQIDLLESGLPGDDPLRAEVGSMRTAVERIQAVAERTLGFVPGKSDPRASCDLAAVIEDARRFVEPYLKSRGVWFQFSVPQPPLSLKASAKHLVQVFVNLFQNAADAMADSSERSLRVRVSAGPGRKRVRIEVEDTGPGIRAEDIDRVFEQFYTTKGNQGTGLGLHIARQIVEDMNGTIAVRCRDGVTTFTILLPFFR